ncbi:CPBP family intramembrane metalloprotease [Rhodococcus erythropolis]|uniref:CPBP family intramembrane glutamic endopeptidase n=1 Tax=Rhodococcus erythropolis TaxID=1833 RepID=UPI001E43A08D|nr:MULTISPECIES: CPBP family intramembrane glutamic endopeptidase [Rhodococcus erythropolis group]MCD2105857.1 CPBP family intramembrane metalloprotease [Rhodococcus qingshengii]MCZ4523538.1 CPBP family intramembrane metalloprotease [Rhodococcus erythropolis]
MRGVASIALSATAITWSNVVLPAFGLSPRARAVVNTAAGLSAIGVLLARGYTREELGLAHTGIRGGAQFGGAAAGAVLTGYSVALAVPSLRATLAADERADGREDFLEWIVLHIPFGTVLSEELLFRSAMSAVWNRELNRPTAQAVHALTFGLWHVAPARGAGDNVPAAVAFTGASALLFEWLHRRGGSVLAPALLHLATNAGGALAVRIATRRHGVN